MAEISDVPTIYETLRKTAAENPGAVSICASDRAPLSYRRLIEHIDQSIEQLYSYGIGCDDRVAIVSPNGPEMATAFLAAASVATCAPLNPAYRLQDYEFYLDDLGAKALIVDERLDSPAEQAALQKGISIIRLLPQLNNCAGLFELALQGETAPESCVRGTVGPDDTALMLHTSGTTARPKMVPLTHRNLCVSAGNVIDSLKLSARDKCLNVMPLFHIHGIVGVLLASVFSGASVFCSDGFNAASFFKWMKAYRPSWYSGVPTMHQAILEQAKNNREIIERVPLRFVRSSSSAIPPTVIKELEEVFNTIVIEAYGMTEAAHQMASNPLPPRVRKPGSVGIAAGPEVQIMREDGQFSACEDVGEIVIRGVNVTPGYYNNQAANAKAFVNGWFKTGDLGRMDSEGYIYIDGRIKEIINRGGEKISPREIDEALLTHPEILQAVAFAVKHPTLGEDIAAAVVLSKDSAVSELEIRQFAFDRLADFKVPSQVVIVESIPTGATGKLQRIGLFDKLAPQLKKEFAAPMGELEKVIADIFSNILDKSPIGRHDNFFILGGDSLRGTQLISRIRSSLKVELPVSSLFRHPTVSELSSAIVRLRGDAETARLEKIITEIEKLDDETANRILNEEFGKKKQ